MKDHSDWWQHHKRHQSCYIGTVVFLCKKAIRIVSSHRLTELAKAEGIGSHRIKSLY